MDVLVEHAAPRYLSLALEGHSLLLLDFVHASTVVLNSSDMGPSVSFLSIFNYNIIFVTYIHIVIIFFKKSF